MLVISAACVPCKQLSPAREDCAHLGSIDGLIIQGDFEGAMKENLNILSRSPKTPPGDAALMNLGLINAHYANPKKDYKKALGFFMRVDKEFPGSAFVEEAKIWVGVLQAFEKSKQVDLDIEEKKKDLGK
jgi:TolA-binding protein